MKNFILGLIIILTPFIYAQNDEWKFSGEAQIRSQLDGKSFFEKKFVSQPEMRIRAGVKRTFLDKVTFFLQVQDSRQFGEESSTVSNSKNLDLNQGYVILSELFDLPVDIQVGRFQIIYGTERFFSSNNWSNIGRVFDAIRFSLNSGIKADLFMIRHNQRQNDIYGLYLQKNFSQVHTVELLSFYDFTLPVLNSSISAPVNELKQLTTAITYFGHFNKFGIIAEAAYQLGDDNGKKIDAYLLAFQASHNYNPFTFTIGADFLSGNDSNSGSNKRNYFIHSYGSNHKYYGFMDYFNNGTANTGGSGLHDFYFNLDWKLHQSKWNASLAFHNFTTNKPGVGGEKVLGQEIDLTIDYSFLKGTKISAGASAFFTGKLTELRNKSTANPDVKKVTLWSFIMLRTSL